MRLVSSANTWRPRGMSSDRPAPKNIFNPDSPVSPPDVLLNRDTVPEFTMQPEKIRYLLNQYRSGHLSEKEQQEWDGLLQDSDYEQIIQEELFRSLQDDSESGTPAGQPDLAGPAAWQPVLQRILSVDKTPNSLPASNRRGVLLSLPSVLRRWSAAAIIALVLISGGLFFLTKKGPKRLVTSGAPSSGNIVPGSNRAILTLANGQQIVLNSAQNGVLSQQGSMQVIKLDSGQLAYSSNKNTKTPSGEILYNTITTPRGGQYQIVLPDETKVWLNAESSLRFPTSFTAKERRVELTGEGYFEVRQDKDKPFLVTAGQTETRVLGTHFNIMAYGDENAVRTTLLEGSVKMGQGNQHSLLRPGEQGEFDILNATLTTKAVNTRAAIAWKDGYYYFDRTPVQSVMRQIARWYNVEIVYQGAIPRDEIVGRIPRTAYVSEVLHIMELIGIHFKIEDRKIIVLS